MPKLFLAVIYNAQLLLLCIIAVAIKVPGLVAAKNTFLFHFVIVMFKKIKILFARRYCTLNNVQRYTLVKYRLALFIII